MYKFKIGVIIIFFLLGMGSWALAEEEWTKSKEANGIVVYTRTPEGSKVKEFKAKTEIKTSLSSLVAVISDIESFPKWYKNAGETKVLEKVNNRKQVYYYEVLVPFPFKNRDMVQETEYSQDADSRVVTATISNMPNYTIEDKGRVRMPIAQGSWTLTPLGEDVVLVEHQFLADPGGSIPKSVVNMLIVGGPYNSLLKLRSFVRKEEYQSARFDWLQ